VSRSQQINDVLEQFSDWSRPWTYMRVTLSARGLTTEEILLVDEIWQEANASVHWLEPSFQSGQELAQASLKIKFSWLSDGAIRNLARGASYMWK